MKRWGRRIRIVLAAVMLGLAIVGVAGHSFTSRADTPPTAPSQSSKSHQQLVSEGRNLFVEGCSSCHGMDARGLPGRAPSLRGVGEIAADFYLRTGRMPMENPHDQPIRRPQNFYNTDQIRALDAYVGSFGGPKIPPVDASTGNLANGLKLFTDSCAGCHQVVTRGGMVPGAFIPNLDDAKPIDVAEAVHIGPYVMPKFDHLTQADVNDIAHYVELTHHPVDRGGWGIGHIGPIPEGMVTFFLAMGALLLGIRIIGERTTQ